MATEVDNLEDIYELSPMQRGMLFHTLYAPRSGVYIEQIILSLQGPLDFDLFSESWQRVVEQHATLRTAFLWEDLDEPMQVVYRTVQIPWERYNWRELSSTDQQARLEEWLAADRTRGFDLASPPLLRLALVRVTSDTHYLLLSHHHLLLDGWSLNIVLQEVLSTYNTMRTGGEPQLRARRPYRDYIGWLRNQSLVEGEDFWRKSLQGFTTPTPLLLEESGSAHLSAQQEKGESSVSQESAFDAGQDHELHLRGGRPVALQGITFSRETTVALSAFARQHQLTVNTLVQGAWALLLSRYNLGAASSVDATTDVIFGATVAGRPADLPGAESMVGLFINTLPVRVRVDPQANLLPWLAQLQEEQAEARQYDFTPLVQVHGWSEVPRDQQLFESLLVFENYHVEGWQGYDEHDSGQLLVRPLQALEQTNYALVLIVEPGAELQVQFGYETARFTPQAIKRALLFLRTLLETFMAHPHSRLADISLLDQRERQQLVSRWNQDERADAAPQPVTLMHLFQEQVSRAPDALALLFPGREQDASHPSSALTYAELDRRSNQLAHHLRSLGVGPEVCVGLYIGRSLDLAIAMLAILKAGGTVVPLDPGYPQERLASILADVRLDQASENYHGDAADLHRSAASPLPFVLTLRRFAARVPATAARVIAIDSEWHTIERESGDPPRTTVLPANAAYILYTSGSTGVPKGVVVTHQSLANHSSTIGEYYALQSDDRVLQFASTGFDVAMEELFPTWLRGATVVMWPDTIAPSPAEFSRFVQAEQLTVLNLPSSYWHAWVSELARPAALRPTSVRLLIVGSEKVLVSHVHTWQEIIGDRISLYNAYGLTETTITSLLYKVTSSEQQSISVPIGQPVAHTQTYVLDTQLAPVPIGMPGELYIGGAGLARGYLHRPDLTAERFVPHPLSSIPGVRLYRTGDLVRSREDGTLEFLGRVDMQVKVRGFRVELGEIEHRISQHAAVSDVVVLAREDSPNDGRLVAYILPKLKNAPPTLPNQLRTYLERRLPSYMVPVAFVVLDSFPRGPSGKVDRRALPAPERAHVRAGEDYVPPRTPLEEILAGVWAAVLHLEHVGRLDNFFKLGGHSLQATQVVARLRELLHIELPVRALYDTPSIQALASFIEKAERSTNGETSIARVDRSTPLPLSFAQQRLWFLDQLQPFSPLYNVPGSFSISGDLDVMALEQSLNALVQRHEPLRTTFAMRAGQPVQIIAPSLSLPLPLADLSHLPDNPARSAEVVRLVRKEAQQPFDLQRGPLVRATLLRLHAREYILLLTLHHIVADGWSAEIFFDELNASYIAGTTGAPAQLPDLPIQYADYAAWQREWLQGEVLEQQLAYWHDQLAGLPPVLDLPLDHARPAVQTFSGEHYAFHLPSSLAAQLRALSQQEGVTLFMVLLAALQTLFSRYSGQNDIAIGTPIAGRTHLEVERLIGFFVNTLVLRGDLSGNPTFIELLGRVREMTLAAYTHQDLPFEKLVEELHPERSLNQSPLFQVLFVLQNALSDSTGPAAPGHGLNLKSLVTSSETAKFDLSFELVETLQGLEGYIEYNTDLFGASTIQRMAEHYITLLAAIASDPEQHLHALPWLSVAERRQILEQWSDPAHSFAHKTLCLPALFEARVALTPDSVSLVLEDHQLTYSELNARANQLAHLLQRMGVGPEVRVGLLFERSLDAIVSLLAILKAGGAYVPLDSDYPSQRLAFLLQDAGITILLTQQPLLSHLPASQSPHVPSPRIVCLETVQTTLQVESCENLALPLSSQQLAYIIYTSGSTGQPKGVMVSHQQVAHLLAATSDWLLGQQPGTWTLFHSLAFDFSVWETWGALLSGGRLVVVPYWQSRTPIAFLQLLSEQRVSVLNQTPSAFWQLLSVLRAEDIPTHLWVRHVLFGGEALDVSPLQSWWKQSAAPEAQLVNLYGITETTVHASWHHLQPGEDTDLAGSPIGRPLPGWQIYLLDEAGQPVPAGVTGEIYVGGAGLARGYLGRPELTAERFVPHPWSARPGERLYRSGDLARWSADGQLVYLGRNDRQVKLRGFRLELGELEARLQEYVGVRQVAATVWEDSVGERQLVAYVVADPAQTPAVMELRTFLRARLPSYMLPTTFVFLQALPLTPHGKLDRRALPDPASGERVQADASAPARTITEEVLIAIWLDVLHINQVGVHDNFFDLGGHSLLATRLMARIRDVYKVDIPLRTVFEAPILSAMADRIEAASRGTLTSAEIPPLTARPEGTMLPLSYAQERLWFLHELEPESSAYAIPLSLYVQGDMHIDALQQSLNAVVQRHEALRTTFSVLDGTPQQLIAPSLPIDLRIKDLSNSPPDVQQQQLQQEAQQETLEPFSLRQGPLLRALLLRLGEQEHVLLLTMHHSVADGWSTNILLSELNSLYSSAIAGTPFSLPALPVQYADYALWQRAWLQGERLERQSAYWREQLGDAPAVLDLPTDYPRPAIATYRGSASFFRLSAELRQQLLALSQQEAGTLFMTLLAAFEVLLLRYSGQTDIVVGTPIAGRTSSETEGLIGLFANTLALRVNLAGNPSFRTLLEQVRDACLEAYTHQDIPFSKVVEAVQPERSLSHHPLFQVMFTLQNAPSGGQSLSSEASASDVLRPYPLSLDEAATKFDLTVEFVDAPDGLQGIMEYNSDLFEQKSIERLIRSFKMLLEGIVINPAERISSFPLLDDDERHHLLFDWNATDEDSIDVCAHQLFAQQVARSPEAVALLYQDHDGEQRTYTYKELDQWASRIARTLRAHGVKSELVVGLYLERSPATIAAVLGVLKAGGAYLPLDPAHPWERLAFMLQETRAPLVLTQQSLQEKLLAYEGIVLCLDSDAEPLLPEDSTPLANTATATNLAYIIYTSGSTGRPKGVMITHGGLSNYLRWCLSHYQVQQGNGSILHSSLSTDMSVTSVFAPLLAGKQLRVLSEEQSFDGLAEALRQEQNLSLVKLTPAHLTLLAEQLPADEVAGRTQVLVIGGEALRKEWITFWQQHAPHTRLINEYGPTETVVGCCVYQVSADERGSSMPIGRPIANTRLYVLDQQFQPVPIGVYGELYIAGAGVARGYLQRPDLTAERFLPDPWSAQPGARFYRTGDLVRYLPDGNLEFLGRNDSQVKLRSYRIELGEIEATLKRHSAVQEAVVLLEEGNSASSKERHLTAYLVGQRDQVPSIAEVRAYLRERLPAYMLPAFFIWLESLPLLPNGKVDRRALLALRQNETDAERERIGEAPRNPVEEALVGIWAQILGRTYVGISDNFFDLGGHSLLITQVISQVRKQLQVELPLRTLFEHPTIAEFAEAVIEQELEQADSDELMQMLAELEGEK